MVGGVVERERERVGWWWVADGGAVVGAETLCTQPTSTVCARATPRSLSLSIYLSIYLSLLGRCCLLLAWLLLLCVVSELVAVCVCVCARACACGTRLVSCLSLELCRLVGWLVWGVWVGGAVCVLATTNNNSNNNSNTPANTPLRVCARARAR